MKENKKGMFTGIKEIFSFTATQTIKGKGFISSTVIIAIVIAIIFGGICVLQAINFDDSDDNIGGNADYNTEDIFETIKEVYLLNETDYKTDSVKKLFVEAENILKEKQKTEIQVVSSLSKAVTNKTDIVILKVEQSSGVAGELSVNILTTFNSTVDEEELDQFVTFVSESAQYAVFSVGKLDEKAIGFVSLPSNVENIGTETEVQSLGMMMARLLVPMIFCLALYMIVLIHGQSISKAIIADKSSKLIEMLLTSVKPYAIVAGKVLGVATVAIGQMLVWLGSGVIGYLIGNEIAKSMNSQYINYVGEVIKIMQSDTQGVAFSAGAVIIAILVVIIGFFMYCVLAAFAGAFVSRIEDLSASNTIFQLPVVISFLVAYLVGIAQGMGSGVNRAVQIAIYYIPLTSPFSTPSGIILGDINIAEGIISLLVLIIFSVIMILATGKVYKGKIFNKH